jgi:hypothetical protein
MRSEELGHTTAAVAANGDGDLVVHGGYAVVAVSCSWKNGNVEY